MERDFGAPLSRSPNWCILTVVAGYAVSVAAPRTAGPSRPGPRAVPFSGLNETAPSWPIATGPMCMGFSPGRAGPDAVRETTSVQEASKDTMGATLATSDLVWRDTSAPRRLVIVADDSLIVQAVRFAFRQSCEFKLVRYADARKTSAQTILGAEPDGILLDDMKHSDRALQLLGEIRAQDDDVALLVLTLDLGPKWLSRAFNAGATAAVEVDSAPRPCHVGPRDNRRSYRSQTAHGPGCRRPV